MIRKLEIADYDKDYILLLSQLTTTGDISKQSFEKQFNNINAQIYVIEIDNKIIASGSILIEQKFIHNCSAVGHIEDVVVDKEYQSQGYGRKLINYLINIGKEFGCYKIILDCANNNIKFYEKLGFIAKETEMVYYINN